VSASSSLQVFGDDTSCYALGERSKGRTLALRLTQAMVLLPLFALILLPEYVQGLGDLESKSILYRLTFGPLRMVDGLLLGLIAVHVIARACSRKIRVGIPKELALPGLGFLLSIASGVLYGALNGGENLFFDWRALALGCGLYVVFALWSQTDTQARWASSLFAGYMAICIALLWIAFLRGGGDVLVGVRIPVFDGPTLSAVVFVALYALCASDDAHSRVPSAAWMILSAVSYLFVLLCFRRTFWAELAIGTMLLVVFRQRRRGLKLLLAGLSLAAVLLLLGPNFYERMQSMDFTQEETEFSQGNPDHVGELVDAWEQVLRNPVMGIGLGRSFPTLRIQGWKYDSVMVHNAPLHVWLKYGALGLVCYVWFHVAVFRKLTKAAAIREHPGVEVPRQGGEAFRMAALAWLIAQFVVSLGFAPWPYSSVQSSILISFILAVGLRGQRTCNIHPCL
jgi:hypothetical protein